VNVLAVVHGASVPPGLIGEVVEERGHTIDEWSLAWGTPPPQPVDSYDAVMIFGGSMHADQDQHHPWLRQETLLLQRLLDQHVPLLGVCLGAQLIAQAANAPVVPMPEPELGWVEVELTPQARDDPLFGGLPDRFPSLQWHYYEVELPAGADELARSDKCTQAFRLGECTWGMQFHPEVTRETLEQWVAAEPSELSIPAETFLAHFDARADEWGALGRELADSFLDVAERSVARAAV
jgi:GMP synthase (glutamine-hydrolysing)